MSSLSIILPFFQVEEYIGACLRSLLPLPEEEVELVLVDDAGQDRSREVAAGCLAGRKNVVWCTHGENRGLSAARNTGLRAAGGEYILFADTDDLVDPQAVMELLHQARIASLDILQGAYETFRQDPGPLPGAVNPPASGVLSGEQCLEELLGQDQFEPMVWQRMFRRAFLREQDLWMPEGMLHEDELFTAPAFLAARRIQISEACFYRYRVRSGSIMGSFTRSSRWCADYLRIAQTLYALGAEPPPSGAKEGLRGRAGDIALSIGKNIVAYGLEGPVRDQAVRFWIEHRREIAAVAGQHPRWFARAQACLLRVSPRGLLLVYRMGKRRG